MESIVIATAAFISAVTVIITAVSKLFNRAIEPIKLKIESLDKCQCKTFLVEFLSDIENGVKKDEVQIQLAYEVYDRYTIELKGNSYVHDKWGKLMK